jgi:hypothetical protein
MDREETPINARPHGRGSQALEDLSLALRDRLLWPLQDRFEMLGDRGRGALAAGAVALAIAAGVGGLALVSSDGTQRKPAVEVAAAVRPAAAPTQPPAEAKPAPKPTLHGAAPVFKPATADDSAVSGGKSVAGSSAAGAAGKDTGSAATDTISSSPAARAAGATTSAAEPKGPPAPPAAVAVAREFARAFVVYETGGDRETVRKGLAATTTPRLRKALLRRPPRQPAGVEVPKAKVVNVVPAPSRGSVYPLSVSLLRVGITSELRLEMERLKNKQWRVVNVLG